MWASDAKFKLLPPIYRSAKVDTELLEKSTKPAFANFRESSELESFETAAAVARKQAILSAEQKKIAIEEASKSEKAAFAAKKQAEEFAKQAEASALQAALDEMAALDAEGALISARGRHASSDVDSIPRFTRTKSKIKDFTLSCASTKNKHRCSHRLLVFSPSTKIEKNSNRYAGMTSFVKHIGEYVM